MAGGGYAGNGQAVAGSAQFCLMLFLGVLYIMTSACLIAFNKYLMQPDNFPYAVALVMIHCAFCSLSLLILRFLVPSLFPSLTDPVRRVAIDRDLILKGALPIALFFSGQLVLSNTAYLHSSVAFLQMMKEANIILVYAFSLFCALERFHCRSFSVLLVVMVATAMTIHGELNFSWTGFCIQGLSQVFECTKLVLQAILLTAAGRKLDALSYVLLVMPLCFAFLSVFFGFLVYVHPNEHLQTPDWKHIEAWWPVLSVNACVALALNIIIALFIKNSSAVAFILAGIVKDAMIVCAGTMLFHEIVTALQVFGFGLQLCAIMVYSLMKTYPEEFEDGIVSGLLAVIFGYGEKTPREGVVADYGALKQSQAAESKC